MRRKMVETQDMVFWYTQNHLTLAEIGKLAGMTRQGVRKRLKKAGVTREQGEWVEGHCTFCGNEIRRTRAVWRKSIDHYCRAECYHADLENPGYFQWRNGCRLARAIIAQYHRFTEDEIVHHKDGDNRNNDLSNLAVFANNSDHVRHHRGNGADYVWDGSQPDA